MATFAEPSPMAMHDNAKEYKPGTDSEGSLTHAQAQLAGQDAEMHSYDSSQQHDVPVVSGLSSPRTLSHRLDMCVHPPTAQSPASSHRRTCAHTARTHTACRL